MLQIPGLADVRLKYQFLIKKRSLLNNTTQGNTPKNYSDQLNTNVAIRFGSVIFKQNVTTAVASFRTKR